MRMRMRRAGAERGYPGTAWVCCWLLGWQAAALQLPPCEEVRFFLLLRGFSPSLGAGGRSAGMYRLGWEVAAREGGIAGCCWPRQGCLWDDRGVGPAEKEPPPRCCRGLCAPPRITRGSAPLAVGRELSPRTFGLLLLPPVRWNSRAPRPPDEGDSAGLAGFLNTALNQCKKGRVRRAGGGAVPTPLCQPGVS